MNTLTGASYFFNLKTGEAAEEHPNLKAAKKTERTQRKLAEEQLSERLATLREYEERLADGRAAGTGAVRGRGRGGVGDAVI